MKKKLLYPLFFILGVVFSAKLVAQEITINEVLASNKTTITDEDGEYSDWIEIYNYGTTEVDLNDFGLSDDTEKPFKWVFPSTKLAPNSYLIIWASDKDRTVSGSPLHTNFKISSSGENLTLSNKSGEIISFTPAIALKADMSFGKMPNGTGDYVTFSSPTPNNTNTSTVAVKVFSPIFSHESGTYKETFDLIIRNDPSSTSANIIYTLDGSEPDPLNLSGTTFTYKNEYPLDPGDSFGPLLTSSYTTHNYTAPIPIYDKTNEANRITTINTNQKEPYIPISSVKKSMVVKAKAYIGDVISETVSKNYFVWSSGNPYSIPIISMQIQENYLFDYNDGIYTAGVDFDNWRIENPDNNQSYRPEWSNYWRSGSDWEYPMHVEIFEPENFNSILSMNAGFRIHGNNSRAKAIKNLRWYARTDYDKKDVFDMNIFDETIYDATNKNNTEFKRILMRGNGTGGSVFYDVVFNKTAQAIFPSGVSRIKPAIHFINGEFWGLTSLRDRMDQHHYSLNYSINSDNIAIVSCAGDKCELNEGIDKDYADYIAMRDFIINTDFSDDTLFAKAEALLDMDSFINHIVIQIFSSDDSYERSYWRARNQENEAFGDGRWRINIKDFEASLKGNVNWLEHWSQLIGNSENESLFGHLLTNESFKNKFIIRFADLLNTAFLPQRFTNIVNNTYNEVAPYLAEDENRYPKKDFYKSSEKDRLINWGNNQPEIFRTQIQNKFTLSGTHNLTLNISDDNAGYIKVNTVDIDSTTPGVSTNPYPWNGAFFNNITTTLEAKTRQGYKFSHWSGDVNSTEKIITINTDTDTQIQANYNIINTPDDAVYFWLFDDQIENNTPLEKMSATFTSTNLEANIKFTSCFIGYPFDNSNINWRKASMERRNLPTAINYRAKANKNIAYEEVNMKGLQIKQPFQNNNFENILNIEFPTIKLEGVKVSFAVQTDGAANQLIIEYWDGSNWVDTNLETKSFSITEIFKIAIVDFTTVSYANNNPNFKMRIRFAGDDMTADNGHRVNFNNISIEAQTNNNLYNKTLEQSTSLKITPNKAYNIFNIESNKPIETIKIYNLTGQEIQTIENIGKTVDISLNNAQPGIYILNATWKHKKQSVRILKK